MEKRKQLFTSCVGEVEGWCPIDHVFYAQYDWTPERGLSEARENKVAHLEAVGDKYIILKCLGRTKPVVQEFAAVEGELRKDIQEKKLRLAMSQEFDRLKESAQIDNFLAGTSQPGRKQQTAAPKSEGSPRAAAVTGPATAKRR